CLKPGEYRQGDCRLCWLYHNNIKYRNKWDEPNIFEKVNTAFQAAISFVKDGLKEVSKEEYNRRMNICNKCDYKDGGKCMKC
ncbi:MAG: hypothetical protein SNJ71_01895, partial [Bacteroidales bacterium]